MSIQFNIEVKAKHLYILGALIVIGVGGVYFSTAYGTNDPANFGHDYGELEGVQKETSASCPNGEAVTEISSDGSVVCDSISSSGSVPSGAIMIFDDSYSPCPDGWEEVDALKGRYPRGADSYGDTGGSSSHSHALESSSAGTQGLEWSNPGYTSPSTDSANHIDPYLNVVYCQKN